MSCSSNLFTESATGINLVSAKNAKRAKPTERQTPLFPLTLRISGPRISFLSWSPTMNLLSFLCQSKVYVWNLMTHGIDSRASSRTRIVELVGDKDFTCVDWSCDGKFLASGHTDGCIRIWNCEGNYVKTLQKGVGPVKQLKWNECGKLILGALSNTTVIWIVESGKLFQSFKFHTGQVKYVDWQTNTTFASCSVDKCIYVCEFDKNSIIKSFRGHTDVVKIAKWDPEGYFLASCSDDKTVKIWSKNDDSFIRDLQGHTGKVTDMKWLPTGPETSNVNANTFLVTASEDSTVKVFMVEKGVWKYTFANHVLSVTSIDLSPVGDLIASGGRDGMINIWSIETGILEYSYNNSSPIDNVSWNHKGNKLVVSSADGAVFVLDLPENEQSN